MSGYGSDEGFNAWIAENGYTLPDGAPSAAVLRERGSVTIDALYGGRFVGEPTGGVEQERAWPRTGAFAMGVAIAPDAIPNAVIKASFHAALAASSAVGGSLVVGTPGTVKRRKVGDVETEFSDGAGAFKASGDVPVTILDGLLAPFLEPEYGFFIRSVG